MVRAELPLEADVSLAATSFSEGLGAAMGAAAGSAGLAAGAGAGSLFFSIAGCSAATERGCSVLAVAAVAVPSLFDESAYTLRKTANTATALNARIARLPRSGLLVSSTISEKSIATGRAVLLDDIMVGGAGGSDTGLGEEGSLGGGGNGAAAACGKPMGPEDEGAAITPDDTTGGSAVGGGGSGAALGRVAHMGGAGSGAPSRAGAELGIPP